MIYVIPEWKGNAKYIYIPFSMTIFDEDLNKQITQNIHSSFLISFYEILS